MAGVRTLIAVVTGVAAEFVDLCGRRNSGSAVLCSANSGAEEPTDRTDSGSDTNWKRLRIELEVMTWFHSVKKMS